MCNCYTLTLMSNKLYGYFFIAHISLTQPNLFFCFSFSYTTTYGAFLMAVGNKFKRLFVESVLLVGNFYFSFFYMRII